MKLKIGIIGGGNMGSAIVGGIHQKYDVSVCEQDAKRARALKRKYKVAVRTLEDTIARSQVIILAVKPQNFDPVLKSIRGFVTTDKLIVSIAAGITCSYIEKRLQVKTRVVRTMPNLPVQVGEGITGICHGKAARNEDLILVCRLFNCVGKAVVVEEKWMDAVTAASGSGPAYVFYFMECLEKAVGSLGLSKAMSKELVAQTIRGSLNLFESQKKDAAVLRARVTSKGGTTQAAMDVFKKHNVEKIFKSALGAAKKRSKELSK